MPTAYEIVVSFLLCLALFLVIGCDNRADVGAIKKDFRDVADYMEKGIAENQQKYFDMKRAENFDMWKRTAEQGIPEGQFLFGRCYVDGCGVPQDTALGVNWWRKAAEQGLAEAAYKLSECYRCGIGVPEDESEAIKWLHRAAEQGHAVAIQEVKAMPCQSHLESLCVALFKFHDNNNGLPPLYTVNADGEPLHSWRVLLLPFLGQEDLYKKIRLDEPWDSEYNRQFHDAIVPCYSCLNNPLCLPGKACTYSAVAGAFRPALRDQGQRPRDSFAFWSDGLSNQIAFIEVKQPFCWMNPVADVTLDDLAKGINTQDGRVGSFHPGGCNICFGYGPVRFASDSVAPAILRALGDPHDGENVSLP